MRKQSTSATFVRTCQFFLLEILACGACYAAQPDPTHPSSPPREGTLVRLASDAAGSEGLVVRISAPKTPRYPQGSPVVVHVTPGGGVDEVSPRLMDWGFVEVRFLWPGFKSAPQPDGTIWASGGEPTPGFFFRSNEVRATADVLAFATGRGRTLENKKLQDYVPTARVLSTNAGVVGWSVGGNLAAAAMGLYGQEFSGLKWYASWESPFGEGMVDGEFGTHSRPNRLYDATQGHFDFDLLRYGKSLPIIHWNNRPPPGAEEMRGSLFLDGNGNGTFEEDADFSFAGIFRKGPPPNVFYAPFLTQAAEERNVFAGTWPAHIANVQQSKEFWRLVDGISHIPRILKAFPELAVIVQASREDHVSAAPDHPHVRIQYEAFRNNGARWVRFNPDRHYVTLAMGKSSAAVVQNPAGKRLDRSEIIAAVEPMPPDGPTSSEAMTAAVCELADRVWTKTWSEILSKTLVESK